MYMLHLKSNNIYHRKYYKTKINNKIIYVCVCSISKKTGIHVNIHVRVVVNMCIVNVYVLVTLKWIYYL